MGELSLAPVHEVTTASAGSQHRSPSTIRSMSAAPISESVAVRVDCVSKAFRLPHERVHTLKERALHPLRRRTFDRLEALHDVSLEVRRGEFFGIVGRNGSGKSTLMKCLAGIYRADAGDMWLRGRLAPFIELGVGFNPDLTARDNVRINAVMLGLSPVQARARYDSIIAFAELQDFQDLKLKNYSSGMQVRLAFSVMVHVDADILLIDEVLAVGDAAFQHKCHDALTQARDAGRTILLVTHDMNQIQRFCDRALLLERGEVSAVGATGAVTSRYHELNFPSGDEVPVRTQGLAPAGTQGVVLSRSTAAVHLIDVWTQDGQGRRTQTLRQGVSCAVLMRVRFQEDFDEPLFGFIVTDEQHRPLLYVSTDADPEATGSYRTGDIVDVWASFDNWLGEGRYFISPRIARSGDLDDVLVGHEEFTTFVVTGSRTRAALFEIPYAMGWRIRTSSEGVEA